MEECRVIHRCLPQRRTSVAHVCPPKSDVSCQCPHRTSRSVTQISMRTAALGRSRRSGLRIAAGVARYTLSEQGPSAPPTTPAAPVDRVRRSALTGARGRSGQLIESDRRQRAIVAIGDLLRRFLIAPRTMVRSKPGGPKQHPHMSLAPNLLRAPLGRPRT